MFLYLITTSSLLHPIPTLDGSRDYTEILVPTCLIFIKQYTHCLMIHSFKHGFCKLKQVTNQNENNRQSAKHMLWVLMDPNFNLSHVLSGACYYVRHLIGFGWSPYSANCTINSNKKEETGNMVC